MNENCKPNTIDTFAEDRKRERKREIVISNTRMLLCAFLTNNIGGEKKKKFDSDYMAAWNDPCLSKKILLRLTNLLFIKNSLNLFLLHFNKSYLLSNNFDSFWLIWVYSLKKKYSSFDIQLDSYHICNKFLNKINKTAEWAIYIYFFIFESQLKTKNPLK